MTSPEEIEGQNGEGGGYGGGDRDRDEGKESRGEDEREDEAEQTFELKAHCLCQTHTFTATVPRTSLPLAASYCHCTSCRHVTGALYSSVVPWPANGAAAVRASSLRRYVFSATMAILYCGVCGSTMFAERRGADAGAGAEGGREGDEEGGAEGKGSDTLHYAVQTGVLVNAAVRRLLTIAHHMFLSDTLDGGASPWLCSDSLPPRLWAGRRGESEELSPTTHHWPAVQQQRAGPAPPEIPIRCHCGGVDLVLRPPAAYFATQPRASLPWFVDPASNKSLAGFDACDSCRLSSGSDVFHWTFVLLRHLGFPSKTQSQSTSPSPSDEPAFPASSIELRNAVPTTSTSKAAEGTKTEADADPRWGTLTFHASSPDVQRYFCARCSASVFYAADDRPELVDLAIGLLHSTDGSRAESLLSWDFGGRMVWRGDVAGGWREAFVEGVEAAAERWRIGRGYPKNWRRVQKEEAARARR
ncbi:Mss4-like protein [Nemania serpens]|nr:Mss4-like protein [Nemania serpens]